MLAARRTLDFSLVPDRAAWKAALVIGLPGVLFKVALAAVLLPIARRLVR
ncbi:MAG: hypothetical protein M3Q61_03170 [Chloroflexota bacterium]|nr:hypothetical protein [Chloroflexota bacterium]